MVLCLQLVLWVLLCLTYGIKSDNEIDYSNIKLFCRDLPVEQFKCEEPTLFKSTEVIIIFILSHNML